MKKIGILTINDYNNYGNRLQNYALQEVLTDMNFEVETIVNKSEHSPTRSEKINTIRNHFKKSPFTNIGKITNRFKLTQWKVLNKVEIHKSQLIRSEKFIRFTENYINETPFSITKKSVTEEDLSKFDYFVTGSDQVWNPNFRYGSNLDFLTFAPKNKRVSYAASFGISEIPETYIKDYTNWLLNMKNISVREEDGAKIVKKLTNRTAQVHVDPTMLLSKDQWLEVSKKAQYRPKKPYILTYFLGGPSEETFNKLKKIANDNNLEIVNLGYVKELDTYSAGPSEFLDYIHHASAFFTDSFHGVIFSIILETPFLVYERQTSGESMYSRIETILDKFEMRNREAINFDDDIFSMDFSGTLEVLENEYDKSINYLKNALRIEE